MAAPNGIAHKKTGASGCTRLVALLCALACAFAMALGAAPAWAETFDEAQADLSLAVSCERDGAPQEGVSYSLYRVADVTEELEFTAVGEFAGYAVDLSDLSKETAETLAAYAVRDGLKPFAEGVTGEDGQLVFSAAETGLEKGLYLLVGEAYVEGEHLWAQEPALVCLPIPDGKGAWSPTVAVTPKASDEGAVSSLEVHKVWSDGDAADRPSSVTVQLLCDGEVAEEAELNAENNWRCGWSDLAPGHVWTAVEKSVPEGYTVTVTREGTGVVITNTKETPATPATPGNKLPQTGQLWWPVPVLLALGLLCLVVGLVRRRSGSNEKRG